MLVKRTPGRTERIRLLWPRRTALARSHRSASLHQFPADAEPMPTIFVIAAGASEVDQNSPQTILGEIVLHIFKLVGGGISCLAC